jgi:predicted transcriptional regulator
MQTTSFNEVLDMHIGKHGTKKREKFEQELRIELLGDAIKKARKAKNLTQEQLGELGELVGVQKAQISKVENSATDARFATILKVFDALDAKVKFSVEIDEQKLMISE